MCSKTDNVNLLCIHKQFDKHVTFLKINFTSVKSIFKSLVELREERRQH